MSDRVHMFECSRSREPDNYIYRWGCAGTNNVYILGHAYGVMKPLHDLYVRGGLRVGMVAIYADSQGRVHWYRVTEWRVVDPAEAAWAIASQPTPSMTLQTCVGKDGSKRLNVRLVQFKVT
jgi:sortase (surface protein transpeptidase)